MPKEFFKNHFSEFGLVAVLVFVILFSVFGLTTKPKLWYDEGLNIELAKNFLDFRTMDIQLSPGKFSGISYVFQSTGYAVIAPLAYFFKFFGFGASQARIYMLLWMVAALIAIYLFSKKTFGKGEALSTILLVATLAPFYGNGRTVVGDIPGFIFFLWALYLFVFKERRFWGGFLFGLAIATKPSLYFTAIPAVSVLLLLPDQNVGYRVSNILKNSFKAFCGACLPILIKIILSMPNPFSVSAWSNILNLFKSPFDPSVSLWNYVLQNVAGIFSSSTLIYFFMLFSVVIAAWFLRKNFIGAKYRQLLIFFVVYFFFAFLYYLKSPGWLRYLIGAELMVFMLLPSAIKHLAEKIGETGYLLRIKKYIFPIAILALVVFQGVYLFVGADLFYSAKPMETVNFIKNNFPNSSIGLFNMPEVSAFIPSENKYQVLCMMGVPRLGKSLVSYNPPLEILVTRKDETILSAEESATVSQNYKLINVIGGYNIYKYEPGK